MKKFTIKIILVFCVQFINAQVLNVNNNEQQYDQWCWAGCSKTILDYYGFSNIQQCDIAEYVRTTATFHNFGSVNCCTNPNLGCNYWNYNWGYSGSIQDILINFGNIQNTGSGALTQAQIVTEITNNRLFVIRWGWSTGGGHFIVGHGISGNNVYFMNPWFGEGLHIGTYNFVKNGVDTTSPATHTWTDTNVITSNMLNVNDFESNKSIEYYPNPFLDFLIINTKNQFENASIKIYNSIGQLSKQLNNINGTQIKINRDNLTPGLYLFEIIQDNEMIFNTKILVRD